MNKTRAFIALALVSFGLIANIYSDAINVWLEDKVDTNSGHDQQILVGLQDNENWLVVPVTFEGDNFDSSTAATMLNSNSQASAYVSQISAGKSTLNTTILDKVWISGYNVDFWGQDSENDRDSGTDGAGVDMLVKYAVEFALSGMDLSPWDFDNNGILDRLLILHSANPQEIGGGSSSIWSHMSGLDNPVNIGEWSINHYTIASTKSGVGTVIHEMLHQMGAYDLYDVHSSLPTSNWNGIGEWGIMASGNWNNNGNTPALPSSSTLELIGIERGINVDYNIGGNFTLKPISNGGNYLSIETGPGEFLKITNRGNHGFDSYLPGHGILVEYQDLNNGDTDSNLVNTDSRNPWLKIIEADGDDALIRNKDTGNINDVFNDGDIFGNINSSQGMLIFDNRGRLVSWYATVKSVENGDYMVEITPVLDTNLFDVLTPRSPIELLKEESVFLEVYSSLNCNLSINITTHNGNVVNTTIENLPTGKSIISIMTVEENFPSAGNIIGTVGCKSNLRNIDLKWHNVGNRIINDDFYLLVDHEKENTYPLSLVFEGEDSRYYNLEIQGAASRISSIVSSKTFSPGDDLEIDINPNNLLVPGMIARGELVFVDNFGIETTIPIVIEAQSTFNTNPILSWFAEPGNGLLMISFLFAMSVLTGGSKRELQDFDESE